MQGILSKRNREGAFDKCSFILTKTRVRYAKLPMVRVMGTAATNPEEIVIEESSYRPIALETVVLADLEEGEYDCAKRDRAFRLLSKSKSFVLRGQNIDVKEEWIEALSAASA